MEITQLITLPTLNGKFQVLLEDYVYEINGYRLTVPKGFMTDLASVPRYLWSILPPFGTYTRAAVVHDYLYSEENNTGINRTLADKIFLFIMKEQGVGFFTRNIMYRGVRSFGEPSWKRKKKNEGYQDKALVDRTEEAKEYYKYWSEKLNLGSVK